MLIVSNVDLIRRIESPRSRSIVIFCLIETLNGWEVETATVVALGSGAEGSITGNVYTIGSDDDPLEATITTEYQEPVTNVDQYDDIDDFIYDRVRSFRYGASSNDTFTATQIEDLATFNDADNNRYVEFRNLEPNQSVSIDNEGGDRFYFMVDNDNTLTISQFGINITSLFSLTDVGGFNVYIQTAASPAATGTGFTITTT